MSRERKDPTAIDPDHGYCAGMDDALRRLKLGRRGPATDADRPPPSILPLTKAARAALRYSRRDV